MNTHRMNVRLSAALLLALVTGLVFAAAPVAAAPPGFGGQGGTLTIALPEGATTVMGNVYDANGPLANAPVQWWDGQILLASTFTDGNGDYTLTPPGFGGQGGTLAIGLGKTSTPTVGGDVRSGTSPIVGTLVQRWQDGSLVGSTYTNGVGAYGF